MTRPFAAPLPSPSQTKPRPAIAGLAFLLALVLAVSLPLAASAEPDLEKAPEGAVVRASVDAVPMPVASPEQPRSEDRAGESGVRSNGSPRGSSQSAAGFRFTNPYAFPQQTLPIHFPTLAPVNF